MVQKCTKWKVKGPTFILSKRGFLTFPHKISVYMLASNNPLDLYKGMIEFVLK